MSHLDEAVRRSLTRRGFMLEYATLTWNVVGIVVLTVAAIGAKSVALAGFGLDSLVEIGASVVVVWELSGTGEARQRFALRLIGVAFGALAIYLAVQSTLVLVTGFHPRHSPLGITWTAITAAAMFARGWQGPNRCRPQQSGAHHRRSGHSHRWPVGHRGATRATAQQPCRVVVG